MVDKNTLQAVLANVSRLPSECWAVQGSGKKKDSNPEAGIPVDGQSTETDCHEV
jgi:hypothetical protein